MEVFLQNVWDACGGGLVCFICTITSLIASWMINRWVTNASDRFLIDIYWLCPFKAFRDLKVAVLQGPVKILAGLGNSFGFMIAPPRTASAGVGFSSPMIMTTFYFLFPDQISPYFVMACWIGAGLIVYMGWRHQRYALEKQTLWEWLEEDAEVKIAWGVAWILFAIGWDILVIYKKHSRWIAIYACIGAYLWFSASGGIAFVYGMCIRTSANAAGVGASLVLPLLGCGTMFVRNITIAEVAAVELIFGFAQIFFPGSHAIFSLVFTGQYRLITNSVELFDFFHPIFLLWAIAFANAIYINENWTTNLPELFSIPTKLWQYATEITSDSNEDQMTYVHGSKVNIELASGSSCPAKTLSPRSPSRSNTLFSFSQDDSLKAYVVDEITPTSTHV